MRTKALALIATVSILAACTKVPISGRRQVNLLPQSTLNTMSVTEYRSFLSTHTVVPVTDERAQMVQTVGRKVADAASLYLRTHGDAKRLVGYNWEFNLIESPEANAFCMPGGKVVVYTGILPITQTPQGLAVVLGHEISHSVANHGNERMSQQAGVQLGGLALDVALSQKPQQTRDLFLQSYGVGSTLGLLKYSRVHESEADRLGLTFMAMAGYDPNSAISFWNRMKSQGGTQPPEFLSTHPSHSTRIEDIQTWIPQAMKYYKPEGTTPPNAKQAKTPKNLKKP